MPSLLTSENITAVQFKESAAPSTPASGYGRLYVNASGVLHYIDDAGLDIAIGAETVLREVAPGGRLTLISGTPVTTSDVTGAGTLYYTAYRHNVVYLYDGSAWVRHTFTERSLSLTLTSGKNYDVFLYNNSGTLALELSAAWTNDTTRADALTTQDGIIVKSGATTRLWLGTIRASGTNQCSMVLNPSAGTASAKIGVWNAYHRVLVGFSVLENANSWTYSGTIRQFNNSANNQIEFVCGLAGCEAVSLAAATRAIGGTVAGLSFALDSVSSANLGVNSSTNANSSATAQACLSLPLGYHYIALLETTNAVATSTFVGDNGGSEERGGFSGVITA